MEAPTPAEQVLSRSYVTADELRFHVDKLSVELHPDRSMALAYRLSVGRHGRPAERWEVALPWNDKSWLDVLISPAPAPDRLQQLLHLVHAQLEEWWDTKEHNRQSARMGQRLH
ncbi:hypothetical protein [Streptomyces sp. SID10815]|uniref:hypothetical protein n=1 Tax=Streptomyces sp. SID10815 TaxID=2706027 RepID=UPI0013CB4BFC|nr:hypothetical protein [Streptomyces sp. SID10815]NEA46699.1 hypothetical protein [Streptomyces sp. SID10815]